MNRFYFLGFYFLLLLSCTTQKTESLLIDRAQPVRLSDQFSFTEGPASDKMGNVYFTDQPNDKIYFWDWKTNKIQLFIDKTGRANGTYFDDQDHLITCSDGKGQILQISKNKEIKVLSEGFEGKRLNGPNDLWIDGNGGIYFTDPLYVRDYWQNFKQEIAKKNLYYRNSNGEVSAIEAFVQPNGIVGSRSQKKLYVSDIDAGKTYVYDIQNAGKLANKKLFCEMGSDGMTLDERGDLYLTGKGVTVFSPQGEKLLNIPIAEDWTSNVTFGGKNSSTLFITASKSVYILKMNVKGMK